jgi:hypothetical protein
MRVLLALDPGRADLRSDALPFCAITAHVRQQPLAVRHAAPCPAEARREACHDSQKPATPRDRGPVVQWVLPPSRCLQGPPYAYQSALYKMGRDLGHV